MRSINFTERKKQIIAFAGIQVASIVVLFLVMSALNIRYWSVSHGLLPAVDVAQRNAELRFFQADSLLHEELQVLQALDMRRSLTADTIRFQQIDNVDYQIGLAEAVITQTIDSIEQISGIDQRMKRSYSRMVNSFRGVLAERKQYGNPRVEPSPSLAGVNSNSGEMERLRSELILKDDYVVRLQETVKTMKESKVNLLKPGSMMERESGELELMKTAFNEQQKELDFMRDKYAKLRKDNNDLVDQLANAKKNMIAVTTLQNAQSSTDEASIKKTNTLSRQIDGLHTDLEFAKIDCNLLRTDAQQMISNARQRKEILSETLLLLNSLAKSADKEIQSMAKERISRLNRIATALHD